jgi:cytidylate kinase
MFDVRCSTFNSSINRQFYLNRAAILTTSIKSFNRDLLITIDGPAGAGKTTISKLLAKRLGYRYLDTGALYRGVAKAVQDQGVSPDDDGVLAQLLDHTQLTLEEGVDGLRLMLNQKDITDTIRTPTISMLASAVSARPLVRDFLLQTQRTIGRQKEVVVEGRDMGTVVFPDADVKFFLSADARVRARRRFDELVAAGARNLDLQAVEQDMVQRDRNDSTRSVAPLQPATDAIHIDSTRMGVDAVVDAMLDHIRRVGKGS